jgi:hypothetical protein
MHIKKHLSFTALRKTLSERIAQIPEHRCLEDIAYRLHDCLMSGFAMMYFQDPSLLQFQRRLEEECQQNNLRTLFNVQAVPKDTQMREVIDQVNFRELEPPFEDYFRALQRGKHLEQYQFLPGYYLISLDGTEYFSSEKIHCPGCLIKTKKSGKILYSHLIVQAALMHPGCRQVIPLAPEPVMNTDGQSSQDCETNAGKRLIKKIRRSHPKLGIIIVGDSLYSKQPFIQELKDHRMHFILAAKPDDHKLLMEWISEQRQLGEVSRCETTDRKGRRHIYEWINQVPLNGNKDSPWINYFEYWIVDKEKITYHHSWVTDLVLEKGNVAQMVRGGRCRWKIENETFNTLKNQGYHLEHNFGHGKKNLSMNFFLLNLLAFFMHQIFQLTDLLYQRCYAKIRNRQELWNFFRSIIKVIIFSSWEELLLLFLCPPRPP